MSEKWNFKVLAMFSVAFWLESSEICKINDHTCMFNCTNTCRVPREMFEHKLNGLMFKQLPWDPANVNAGFSMTRIFVRFDAHLDQMTQITITTASWWTQSCVRSTCFENE